MLFFLFLSACIIGTEEAGSATSAFADGIINELECSPCDLGFSEQRFTFSEDSPMVRSIGAYDCRDSRIEMSEFPRAHEERSSTSKLHYVLYDNNTGEFPNRETMQQWPIIDSKADPEMVALVELAQQLGCGPMKVHPMDASWRRSYGESWRDEYSLTCWPSTCIVAVEDGKPVIRVK